MLPNLFVIGAPKCGTTSFHMYLDEHPQIHMSAVKEPRFFAAPVSRFAGPRIGDRAEYERLFDSSAPVRGESSPSYSQYPIHEGVPERIEAAIPDARIIYLVGDPVARVLSHHVQRMAQGDERRTLTEAIGDLDDPFNPYVCPSRYATQLERYLSVFDAERLLVIDKDELAADRAAVLRRTFAFLGVDEGFSSPAFERRANPSSAHRQMPRGYEALRRGPVGRLAKRAVPASTRSRITGAIRGRLSAPIERPSLGGELQHRLERALAGEADRLRALTGQEFGGWTV